MKLTKAILILLVFTIFSCKSKDKITPENHIELVYYKDKDNNDVLTHIGTNITERDDDIGIFIKKHKPRFSYFFSNKINVDTLEKLYPDTLAIKELFKKQINEESFILNFSKLTNLEKQKYESFSMDEIMEVASRFFDIVDVGNSFGIKICAGGNYFEDLNAAKDISLIESLVYEAIIGVFDMKKNERPEFILNARINFSDAIKNPDSLNKDKLLIVAKNKLYRTMEKDKSLRLFISNYLTEHSSNLPFKVKNLR
jgi:predicted RND superfamily exporter protein